MGQDEPAHLRLGQRPRSPRLPLPVLGFSRQRCGPFRGTLQPDFCTRDRPPLESQSPLRAGLTLQAA